MFVKAISKEIKKMIPLKRLFSTNLTKTPDNVPVFFQSVQFSKAKLTDFGELPKGEIPHALQFSPQNEHAKLDNKVQVITECYSGEFASVSVFVKAGSRFETIESSGSSHFLTYLLSKGSKKHTRKAFQKALDLMGAHVEVTTGREIIGFTLKVNKADVKAAVQLLSDAVVNPDFDANQIETDKEFVHRQIMDVSRDQFEFTKEALFYTSFRDHMMGQSQYGIRDNIPSIKAEMLQEFHANNFVGENVVFVVSGDINQAEIVETVKKATNELKPTLSNEQPNTEPAWLTGSVMSQRDDEMYNMNSGVGYRVAEYGGKNFFAFKMFEKILGNFNAENHGNAHLNSSNFQYNATHTVWSDFTGINLTKVKYEGFSDVGLFTGYVHGNDFWANQIYYGMSFILGRFAISMNHAEVVRARVELFNELLNQRPSKGLNEEIAKEVFYIGRRINRTEYASRYSNLMDTKVMMQVAKENFYNQEVGIVLWGPLHNVCTLTSYGGRVTMATKGSMLTML